VGKGEGRGGEREREGEERSRLLSSDSHRAEPSSGNLVGLGFERLVVKLASCIDSLSDNRAFNFGSDRKLGNAIVGLCKTN
jgi:hypothetical protein